MNLTLTARQRLSLESVIRSKRNTNLDDAVILHEIQKLIKVPEEQRKLCFKQLLSGQVLEDPAAIDAIESLTIELERAQAMKLKSRLDEWRSETGVSTDDIEWFVPLIEDLTAAAKYKAAE